MGKKLSAYKILGIAKAINDLDWYGKQDKRIKKIIKQLRKRLRKGA